MPPDSDTAGFGEARLLDELTTVVSRACAAILDIRVKALDARPKADLSPVTAADEAAETIILEGLTRLLPGVQIVSEEAASRVPPKEIADCFVLVDPIDGTRELVAGRDEFTVNIGIIRGRRPVLGIVATPAAGNVWRGIVGKGAERLRLPPGADAAAAQERVPIRPRPLPSGRIIAAVSRSNLDAQTIAFLGRLHSVERVACGSSVKLCRVAEGAADVYPRLGTVNEWDLAGGHAVVLAAGGIVTAPNGGPLSYGHLARGLQIAGFIAWGDPSAPEKLGITA